MKAAVAILSDYPVQNTARRMVYKIHQRAGIRFFGSLLPAHVSLKQTFTFESLERLESWFGSLSQKISPFVIELDRVYYDEWEDVAIVGLHVIETPILRALHDQINEELKDVVRDPSAAHDGEDYCFHLTVELGKVGAKNPFKEFYESLSDKDFSLSFTAAYIALFIYADGPIESGSFICYKVLPLGT